ncbi:cytochrome-c peroxidase [Vibrio sp. WXL210]|uniref:cytochrome-c peroxidase n=1 Tax=Vibrio sp. WXL210 TaxID=3450709 RepID=UPI003EC521CF
MVKRSLFWSVALCVLIIGCEDHSFSENGSDQHSLSEDSHDQHHHHDSHSHQHSAKESASLPDSRSDLVFPLPEVVNSNQPLARLGWKLFNDPNLSSNGQISCNSCHDLATNGADLTPLSVGVGGLGERNSPTVFNVSLNTRFFWDGRSNTLEAQVDGPIHNPLEMANNWLEISQYLREHPEYPTLFAQAGIEDIGEHGVKRALSYFQAQLITPPSRFDQFLAGKDDALTAVELAGWEQFNSRGCIVCHQGPNVGGSIYQKFGYYIDTDLTPDVGRQAITGDEIDRSVFRVPSLRNVSVTAPYFHDGKVMELKSAIYIMGKVQLGQELDEQAIAELAAFLESLETPRPIILGQLENED